MGGEIHFNSEVSKIILVDNNIEKISKENIDLILHAAMSGPSACNRQPWDFYVVTKEEKLKELKSTSMFTKFDAPLAIVVCGITIRRRKNAKKNTD